MKRLLIVLLTLAVLVCPVLAASGEAGVADDGPAASWNLAIGNCAISEQGTYYVTGTSTQYGISITADGYVTLVLTGNVEAKYIDCGSATVYIFFGDGTDNLTVGDSVFHGSTVLTGVLGTAPAAAAAEPAAAASGEPAAAAQPAASGEPAAAAESAASGEPAAAASGEPAATESAASGETASSAEPAAEEAAEEPAGDAVGANITDSGWSTIELVCVIVLVVECVVLMLSFGKKKNGSV